MKNAFRVLLSLAVSALCIYFATRNVHWQELKTILAGARLWPLALGVAVSLFTFFLRSLRWEILLQPFQEVPVLTLMRWQIGGLFVNNLLPLRMGELARAYWAGHKAGIAKSTVFATIVIERVSDVASIGCIGIVLILSLGFYKTGGFPKAGTLIGVLLGLAALTAAALYFSRRLTPQAVAEGLKKVLPEKAARFAEKFVSGFGVLQDKKEFFKVIALSFLIWSVDIGIIAVFSRSLGLNLSWSEAALTIIGLVLGVMLPAAPGAAGTYEAGGVAALGLLGYDKTLAFSFILLVHAVQYLSVAALGIPIMMAEGFNPKKIYEEESEDGGEKVRVS